MEKITARYDPGTTFFLLSMQNGIFDATLTAGAIGGEPYILRHISSQSHYQIIWLVTKPTFLFS